MESSEYAKLNEEATFAMVFEGLKIEGLIQAGVEWKGFCCVCDKEQKGKKRFWASEEKKQFRCYSCQKNGNILQFVKDATGQTTADAAMILASILDGREKDAKQDWQIVFHVLNQISAMNPAQREAIAKIVAG